MNINKLFIVLAVLALLVLAASPNNFAVIHKILAYLRVTAPEADFLSTPGNIKVSVFADGLSEPRVIAFDQRGRIFISETKAGRITRLDDTDADGIADSHVTILEKLNKPHGLAFYTDSETNQEFLYVAEVNQVARYQYSSSSGKVLSESGKNMMNFPKVAGQHTTRTIGFSGNLRVGELIKGAEKGFAGFGSPSKLYASVGSTCDACIEYSWKSGAILESDPNGQYTAEFAGGLHDPEFFTFHPTTGKMWATEIGRGDLGDNLPPDEINIITENGKYGWPFCYGSRVKDVTFAPAKIDRTDIPQNCALTKPPVIEIPAHSAPLGLGFIPSGKWQGNDWGGNLIVALHGSVVGKTTVGYKIVRYDLDKSGKILRDGSGNPMVSDLIWGWYKDGKALGQPVDVKFAPDGTLYISDDLSGRIYRATFSGYSQ